MKIDISDEPSLTGGFISWQRLAAELFPEGHEISAKEKITRFEISERGINYFVVETAL